ncbi:hypothetical protein AGMMS49982_12180 [Bacteroidia bacterium]|nr:hypothetical protein AGMMS49982_12180 [Bacteroidia bacterium]
MTIGILYICTGQYAVFWQDFYLSAKQYLFPGTTKKFFVFTDAETLYGEGTDANIIKINIEHREWPFNAVLRYEIFDNSRDLFADCDYLFFYNSNVLFTNTIALAEILPTEKEARLVALSWKDVAGTNPDKDKLNNAALGNDADKYRYDRHPASQAYVPYGQGTTYYQSGFNGGRMEEFVEAIQTCKKWTALDLQSNIIALVHDESYWNKYLLDKQVKTLDLVYGKPEEWAWPANAKVIFRDKNKVLGKKNMHRFKREKRISFWTKFLRTFEKPKEELPPPLPYQYLPMEKIGGTHESNENHQVFFVSFADTRMRKSAARLTQQAIAMNVFDEIYILDERNLSVDFLSKFKDKLRGNVRGFGYWAWKPQIILQVMERMAEGDVLLFTDMGCHLNPERRNKMLELIEKTKTASSGILAFQMRRNTEKWWTKGDLLDYFGVRKRTDITESGQVAGTFFLLRKCQAAEKMIREWMAVFENNFELIDDSLSLSPNLDGFREHRHDQSIFSLLCKVNQVTLELNHCRTLKSEWKWKKYPFPIQARRDKK